MNDNFEYRYSPFAEIRSSADGMELACYFARFNERSFTLTDSRGDKFDEILLPGCFTRALQTSRPKALVDHDPDQEICDLDSGLSLWQDDIGLAGRIQLPETQFGRHVRDMVRSGELTGCSFCMTQPIVDSWRPDGDRKLRTIRSIRGLEDVSLVHNPAYGLTSIDFGTTPVERHIEMYLNDLKLRILEKTYAR